MTAMLAQTAIDIPLSDTMKTVVGLIGVMTLGITILTFVTLVKKVFGRTPPLDKEFAKLRAEFYEVNGRTKKAIEKDLAASAHRMDGIDQEIEEIKVDRERKWAQLQNEIHALDLKLANMLGRVDFLIRKIEQDHGE
jgi:hypothetical protein